MSSNGSELGCCSIIHAGGAGGVGHSGGTYGCDVQPTLPSSNISSKAISFGFGGGQLSGVSLVDLGSIGGELTLQPQRSAQAACLSRRNIALTGNLGNRLGLPICLPPEQAHYQQQGRDHA